ncbi:MAG: tRNA preQ1(34) S-adenosylmethionine ribosyltransferase-isomerase QueA [Gammaproteobacteria bacterium]
MQLSDFDYALPDELIAQRPPATRRDARLLVVGADALEDRQVTDLPGLLRAGDLVVLNDTRVIPARLFGRKDTGGRVEILIERCLDERRALAHVRASKTPRPGSRIAVEPAGELEVAGREGELFVLETSAASEPLTALLERSGHVPLPPYIERADVAEDRERYQTVYARRPGAVAAPTAGLHFDEALLDAVRAAGADIGTLTLHVGAGTFQPVRGDDVDEHVMHAERVHVPAALCQQVNATRAAGGRVVAIGTTVMRALEAAARRGLPLEPFDDDTQLFIRPGFEFRVVDAMLTNFHLPRSTLLMLVSAFVGHARLMAAYRYAVDQRYRFFSYGDAMFLTRTDAAA